MLYNALPLLPIGFKEMETKIFKNLIKDRLLVNAFYSVNEFLEYLKK